MVSKGLKRVAIGEVGDDAGWLEATFAVACIGAVSAMRHEAGQRELNLMEVTMLAD